MRPCGQSETKLARVFPDFVYDLKQSLPRVALSMQLVREYAAYEFALFHLRVNEGDRARQGGCWEAVSVVLRKGTLVGS
jgi:hypothetical protein